MISQDPDWCERCVLLLLGSPQHLQHRRPPGQDQRRSRHTGFEIRLNLFVGCSWIQIVSSITSSILTNLIFSGDNVDLLHNFPLFCHELCLLQPHHVSKPNKNQSLKPRKKLPTKIPPKNGKNKVPPNPLS